MHPNDEIEFLKMLTEQERALLESCKKYAANGSVGFPVINLVSKLESFILKPSCSYLKETIRKTLPAFYDSNAYRFYKKDDDISLYMSWLGEQDASREIDS